MIVISVQRLAHLMSHAVGFLDRHSFHPQKRLVAVTMTWKRTQTRRIRVAVHRPADGSQKKSGLHYRRTQVPVYCLQVAHRAHQIIVLLLRLPAWRFRFRYFLCQIRPSSKMMRTTWHSIPLDIEVNLGSRFHPRRLQLPRRTTNWLPIRSNLFPLYHHTSRLGGQQHQVHLRLLRITTGHRDILMRGYQLAPQLYLVLVVPNARQRPRALRVEEVPGRLVYRLS